MKFSRFFHGKPIRTRICVPERRGVYSQIPGRLLLWDRSIRGERRSRGCENLSLSGVPETAWCPHAVGRHFSQAPCEVHRRIEFFNQSELAGKDPAQCCIGIGYGEVYAIGIDQAMGDEMNRACKLGEDIAKGTETLVTECAYDFLKERIDCKFQKQIHDQIPFPFYQVLIGKENSIKFLPPPAALL